MQTPFPFAVPKPQPCHVPASPGSRRRSLRAFPPFAGTAPREHGAKKKKKNQNTQNKPKKKKPGPELRRPPGPGTHRHRPGPPRGGAATAGGSWAGGSRCYERGRDRTRPRAAAPPPRSAPAAAALTMVSEGSGHPRGRFNFPVGRKERGVWGGNGASPGVRGELGVHGTTPGSWGTTPRGCRVELGAQQLLPRGVPGCAAPFWSPAHPGVQLGCRHLQQRAEGRWVWEHHPARPRDVEDKRGLCGGRRQGQDRGARSIGDCSPGGARSL